MKRILRQLKANERGLIFPLVLVLLAVGALTIIPFVHYTYTGSKASSVSETRLVNEYAANAGVEDAIWKLVNVAGFKESLTGENPLNEYSITVNGKTVDVTIAGAELDPPVVPEPERMWWHGISVWKEVAPNYVQLPLLTPATVNYTIYLDNEEAWITTYEISDVRDLLPVDSTYVTGSTSGATTADPVITMVGDQEQLQWTFSPVLEIPPGSTVTLSFSAEVNFTAVGLYYNIPQAYVSGWDPYLIGLLLGITAGWSAANELAPIAACWPPYDITAQVGNTVVKARIDILETGPVILSWKVE